MNKTRTTAVAMLVVSGALMLHAAHSQQTGIKRTQLLQRALSVPGREVVQVRVEFAPGAAFPEHSHPGEEFAYVIEGSLEYQLDGQPPVRLEAGEVLFVPAGAIHSARNVGKGNAAELATYIVEQGKPLVVQHAAR